MAAIDPSDSRIGHGCFRARPSDDREDPCLPGEKIEVNLDKKVEKSAEFVNKVRQVILESFWHRKRREKTAPTGLTACWKGWEQDATRPSRQNPSLAISIPDQRDPPNSHRVINHGNTSPLRDVSSGKTVRGPVIFRRFLD